MAEDYWAYQNPYIIEQVINKISENVKRDTKFIAYLDSLSLDELLELALLQSREINRIHYIILNLEQEKAPKVKKRKILTPF